VRRPVAIVSNNSAAAITAYLNRREMAWSVAHVLGRDPHDPARMKPNTWTLTRALDQLDVAASDAVLIGDAVTDVEAARALGMPSIGYANHPAKTDALRGAGADDRDEHAAPRRRHVRRGSAPLAGGQLRV
jgi:beta-phosphoglucomutase-like phosphatase (HAD superfamily)